ncbi:MAG: hypothetical protein KBS38_02500 [Bacteroidales bacterium]|nr:hypothetical protein [Candidatus Cacconaster caballi]
MKRIILSIIAIISGISLNAQSGEEIIGRIAKAGEKGFTIERKFNEVRKSAGKKAVTLDGDLKWKDGNLVMDYSNGEHFSIEGTRMTIRRGGKQQVFDLTKNMMMKALSHALTYSFEGKLMELSKEQNTNLVATRDGKEYVVTLNATRKAARGYNRIVVRYDTATCCIKSMIMDEFNGTSTSYTIE